MSRSTVTLRHVLARARPASSSNVRPIMQKPVQQRPVPAKTDLSFAASSSNERNTLARLDGPQREALDCQETSCLNDAAAGSFHARSTASSAWITDDAIASGLTFVRLRTTPTPATARTTETITAARAAVQILVFDCIAARAPSRPETIGLNSGKSSARRKENTSCRLPH